MRNLMLELIDIFMSKDIDGILILEYPKETVFVIGLAIWFASMWVLHSFLLGKSGRWSTPTATECFPQHKYTTNSPNSTSNPTSSQK